MQPKAALPYNLKKKKPEAEAEPAVNQSCRNSCTTDLSQTPPRLGLSLRLRLSQPSISHVETRARLTCLRSESEPRTSWASTGRPSPRPRARHIHNCFEVDNAQLILDLN